MTRTLPEEICARLCAALDGGGFDLPAGFDPQVAPTNDPRFGDYQSNAAMVLGKHLSANPREVASRIIDGLDVGDLCESPEIAGPGFLNFRIRTEILNERVFALLGDDALGVSRSALPRTIVIDFSAPNVAKPMHVGHIRSTFIGDALARIARLLGHTVITDNHIGDWGKQFGMILYGWKNRLDQSVFESDPIGALVALYREVNALAKENPEIDKGCRAELVKLQQGDSENLAIWEKTVELSRRGLERIYEPLDVHFDHWLGESAYNDRLAALTAELIEKGIATESEGAICAFFPEDAALAERGPCIVRKTDGGFGYAATDIATIERRVGEFKADEIWYVVGAPQQLHFDQVFSVARKLGIEARFVFIPFGSILGEDRKMLRTREGEPPQLADLITESVDRARAIIEEKNPALPDDEKEAVAAIIGVGALKYAELSQNRMTDYIFAWDKMLSMQGNTAPYLQNAHVRIRSIFRKLDGTADFGNHAELSDPSERALALKILQFGEVVPETLADHRPNTLATYLYELATTFHSFYESCPVLSSEGITRSTRLVLCELTARALRQGLDLLGVKVPDRM